jgi:PST family polysaccharide transporter
LTAPKGIKILAGNMGALTVLQAVNYLAPLLLIPYLTRVLGIELYGVVAFGLAMAQIACMLTDYGFNLSATYQITKTNGDKAAISRIIGAVMVCKLGLLLVSTLILALFIGIDHKYDDYEIYFWLLLLAVLGQTFQPIWFFQGIERMLYITLYSGASRLLYLVSVLLLVSSAQDYWLVAVSNGVSHILAAVLGLVIMVRMGYSMVWPGWSVIRTVFKDSTPFFWARAAVSAYTAGGTVFLGLVSTPVQAGLYAAAEQLYRAAVMMIAPLHQALYPYMARTRDVRLFGRILLVATLAAALGLVVGIAIGPWVVHLIYGPEFHDAYPVLVVFMAVFAIVIPSALLGYPFLAALGNATAANRSVMLGGAVQIVFLLACYVAGWTQATETVFTVLAVEIVVITYRILAARRLIKNVM